MIAEGCEVYGSVRGSRCCLPACTVEEGALVEDSVIMPGTQCQGRAPSSAAPS